MLGPFLPSATANAIPTRLFGFVKPLIRPRIQRAGCEFSGRAGGRPDTHSHSDTATVAERDREIMHAPHLRASEDLFTDSPTLRSSQLAIQNQACAGFMRGARDRTTDMTFQHRRPRDRCKLKGFLDQRERTAREFDNLTSRKQISTKD
jgi:hypothetical protein